MSQSILTFDFGTNEEAAQQARHKVEGWKQGFRLGNKMTVKFEREAAPELEEEFARPSGARKPTVKKPGAEADAGVRVLLRLDFSDHEKLSHQRWLDRIPAEEPFKSARSETVRTGDPEFPKLAELFESLD